MRSYCLYLIHTTASDEEREEVNNADKLVVQPGPLERPAELSPIPAPATTTAAHPGLLPAAR